MKKNPVLMIVAALFMVGVVFFLDKSIPKYNFSEIRNNAKNFKLIEIDDKRKVVNPFSNEAWSAIEEFESDSVVDDSIEFTSENEGEGEILKPILNTHLLFRFFEFEEQRNIKKRLIQGFYNDIYEVFWGIKDYSNINAYYEDNKVFLEDRFGVSNITDFKVFSSKLSFLDGENNEIESCFLDEDLHDSNEYVYIKIHIILKNDSQEVFSLSICKENLRFEFVKNPSL